MKLPKGTFSNIPETEVKKLLQGFSHPNISGAKDYIRDRVSDIISGTGENTISSESFTHLKEEMSSDEISQIQRIVTSSLKSVSLSSIHFLSKISYDEISMENMCGIICMSDSGIIDRLIDFCKTKEVFISLYGDEEIRKSLESAKSDNLEYIFSTCKKPEDFIDLAQEESVRRMFWGFEDKLEILKIITSLSQDPQDLKSILIHENLGEILGKDIEIKLQYFIKAVSLTTISELLQVLDQKTLCQIIKYRDSQELQYLLDLCNISTVDGLIPISGKGGVMDKLIESNKDSLDFVLSLLGKNSPGDIISIFNENPKTITNLGKAKLDILEYLVDVFEISDIDGLESISQSENYVRISQMGDIDPIEVLLQAGDLDNMKAIFTFYNISSVEQYRKITENVYFAIMLSSDTPHELLNMLLSFCETPEYFSMLCESESIIYMIENGIPESILGLVENEHITKEEFFEFYKRFVSKSRDNARVILQNKIPYSREFGEIFRYFFDNKKKSLISFIDKLSISYEYDLGIDVTSLRSIDDFKNTTEGGYDFDGMQEVLIKMLSLINLPQNQEERMKRRFGNARDTGDIGVIQNILADVSLEYFERLYHKKWNIKLKRELNISGDIGSEKLDNQDFIEAYKMSVSPDHNKEQIQKLLGDYLSGKFDDTSKRGQFDTQKNQTWLQDNLKPEQQDIWFSTNLKEINTGGNETIESGENDDKTIIKGRIDNHVDVAIRKIKDINALGFSFKENFRDSGELQRVFNVEIKKAEGDIRNKDSQNLYDDLKLQIEAIKQLKQNKGKVQSKPVEKVTIQRELDPLKCLMMGNWVDGSCLSFYSSVGNYWSSISNTVDANKGVYYTRDGDGNLLGRCLLTIGEDGKLTRYKMYYAQPTNVDIDSLFSDYTREIAKKMGLELNGNQYQVENIECEKWYHDGEVPV